MKEPVGRESNPLRINRQKGLITMIKTILKLAGMGPKRIHSQIKKPLHHHGIYSYQEYVRLIQEKEQHLELPNQDDWADEFKVA